MVSRSDALRALKALHRQPINLDKTPRELFDPDTIYGDATKDRAVALVAATILDQSLQMAIATRLISLNSDETEGLFGPNQEAPLSSFSARIKIGYAIGIYNRIFREDLDCIRLIRNAFAHVHGHIDYKTTAIIEVCEQFNLPKMGIWAAPTNPPATAKDKFMLTVTMRSILLIPPDPQNDLSSPSKGNPSRPFHGPVDFLDKTG
jgi:DNA-binding MltR family transcriptional regulator